MAAGDVLDETATSGVRPRRAGESFRPGDQIGRYVVERLLGAGGMGVVYAAHDPDLDRRIAVKVLRGDASDESRTRLLREARAMAKLSHANVITVYEVGTAGDIDFVAMELIEGGSIADWLRGERRPSREVHRLFRAAGRGLAAAHACGLVHRDFKPANVLLGRDGKVVVTDFGLARAFEADPLAATATAPAGPAARVTPVALPVGVFALDQTMNATAADSTARRLRLDSADLSSPLTRTGALLGTPAYMAPEQFAGESIGPAADQFAFAVALWEGFAGERPFRGATLDELRTAVGKPPDEIGKVPRALRPILLRALAPTPQQRWRDLDAMLAAIDRTERRPLRLAALGALVLLGGGVALAVATRSPDRAVAPSVAACALTDADLTTAWSPDIAARVTRHFGDAPDWIKARGAIDEFAAAWRTERAAACAEPDAVSHHGRVACLAGLRDELAAATSLLEQLPVEALRGPGMRDLLAQPAVCRTGRRAAMPPLPADPQLRTALSEIVRDSAAARFTARGGDAKAAATLAEAVVATARQLSYPPALAIALEAQASVIHIGGDCSAALPRYAEAATAAEAASADGIRAMSRIGQLECGIRTSSDLAQIQQYASQADAAILRAGNDAILRAALDLTLGSVAAETGDLDGAITRAVAARKTFLEHHDARRAARALSAESSYRTLRDGPGNAEALQLARDSFAQTVEAFGDGHRSTEDARLELGLRLLSVDPAEGRALIATAEARRPPTPPPADAVRRRGRVRASDGTVLGDVTIYAGVALVATSDGEPIAYEPGALAVGRADADGDFDLITTPGAMIYAAAPGWRSLPTRAAARGPLDVRLERAGRADIHVSAQHPTAPSGAERAVELGARVAELAVTLGHIDGNRVYQSYSRRTAADQWVVEVAPAGRMQVALVASSGLNDIILVGGEHLIRAGGTTPVELAVDLRGQVIDVIVRADRAATIPTAQLIAFAGRPRRLPRTNLDVYKIFGKHPRAHFTSAAPVVDATRTQAGAALYQPGDIHGRLAAMVVGPTTICALPLAGDVRDATFMRTLAAADDLEMRCTVVEIASTPGVQAFVIETPPMKRRPPTPPAPPAPPSVP